jgi:hypothetical protein
VGTWANVFLMGKYRRKKIYSSLIRLNNLDGFKFIQNGIGAIIEVMSVRPNQRNIISSNYQLQPTNHN